MRRADARAAEIAAAIAAGPFPEGVTATVADGRVAIAGRHLRERVVTDPALAAIGWRAVR